MKITFYGATQEVTGSKYVIETQGFRLLLDCGLHQGKRDISNALNKKLPFDVKNIDAMILSHAHADHSGMVPVLVKEGFDGKIYCTSATADITKFILEDSANISEEDSKHYNKHLPAGQKPIEPMYTQQDVKNTFKYFSPVPYFRLSQQWTHLNENIRFKFYDAGHILGSAITLLEIKEQGMVKRLVFTGDLGRKFLPILRDPEDVAEPAETLVMECTYGDRLHKPVSDLEGELKAIISEAIKNKSKIIVPAFSLGRTQELLYVLHKIFNEKDTRAPIAIGARPSTNIGAPVPALPIYVDSPLAKKITRVFQTYTNDFDETFWKDFGEKGQSPFLFKNLITTGSVEESKSINDKPGPMIIIAGSGMCEGGRVLHHLKNNIKNPNSVILITGYQAQNTLGRKIIEGVSPVRIFGENYQVKAKVIILNELSAHADQKDLLNFVGSVKELKNIFLVHTEMPQAEAFEALVKKEHPNLSVDIPVFNQEFEI